MQKVITKKNYALHQLEYEKMRRQGIKSWSQRDQPWEIDPNDKRFLADALAQPWAPKRGTALEIGCGTAPILRWLTRRGFSGFGVDISRTALEMARAQSKGRSIGFAQADICRPAIRLRGRFDLAVDGLCLHCVTKRNDRQQLLRNVFTALKPGGLLLVMTMCSPVNRAVFRRRCKRQRIINHVIYAPIELPLKVEGTLMINGKRYLATRYIGQRSSILSELRDAGFQPLLIWFNRCVAEEPCSSLCVAAVKRQNTSGR